MIISARKFSCQVDTTSTSNKHVQTSSNSENKFGFLFRRTSSYSVGQLDKVIEISIRRMTSPTVLIKHISKQQSCTVYTVCGKMSQRTLLHMLSNVPSKLCVCARTQVVRQEKKTWSAHNIF